MAEPLVSIIIPIYNVEAYIEECLNSLIKQTYTNLEIICVNDCSPDNSAAVVQKYAAQDPRIIFLTHEVNKGVSEARNSGLNICTGEYIIFVDPDDYVKINCAARLVKLITETGADIGICRHLEFYENKADRLGEDATPAEPAAPQPYRIIRGDEIEGSLFKLNVSPWAKIYRADFIQANHFRFIPGIIHEDEPWCLVTAFKAASIALTNEYLYCYRKRPGSITTTITYDYTVSRLKTLKISKDLLNSFNLLDRHRFEFAMFILTRIKALLEDLDKTDPAEAQNIAAEVKQYLKSEQLDEVSPHLIWLLLQYKLTFMFKKAHFLYKRRYRFEAKKHLVAQALNKVLALQA